MELHDQGLWPSMPTYGLNMGSTSAVIRAALALLLAGCTAGDTTAPHNGTTSTGQEISASGDLLVIGDWGAGTTAQEQVAETMADHARDREIAAILTTGDNFYSDDVDELIKPFGWATDGDIPFLVAWGNHDIESEKRIELTNEVFDDPPRWVRHEWGQIDIVILDSTQIGEARQIDFLDRALESDGDPTIVVFHHPPYSCGSHGDTVGIGPLVDAFDDDVFLVLTGHEHNYQRFAIGGVSYVVTGGGGATLTELADCAGDHPQRLAGESTHHFLALEQDDDVTVTVIDANGDVIDEFSLDLP